MTQHSNLTNRRAFLSNNGVALGSAALASLLSDDSTAADRVNASARTDLPHHLAKAKRVIFLCMAGGPSHLETFDYKPELQNLMVNRCQILHCWPTDRAAAGKERNARGI